MSIHKVYARIEEQAENGGIRARQEKQVIDNAFNEVVKVFREADIEPALRPPMNDPAERLVEAIAVYLKEASK